VECARARRSFNSEKPSSFSQSSATAFSKNRECIPVAPTLPISSLSTRMQQAVRAVSSVSSMAARDVYAQILSSCP